MEELLGGRYRTTQLIANGGSATIYRAVDEHLDREVAVKLFPASTAGADDVRRQEIEVKLLATLSHPGLITLIDAGLHATEEDVPRAFLVMELIDGPDLRGRLKEGPLPSPDVMQIGADLADSLHYIHNQGVIHRDVKPANVLMADQDRDTRPHPKLTDFGIARNLDSSQITVHGATLGTASYLSPEQATGTNVSTPTDIYSLGLVLLECLTGVKAFPGPLLEATVARLLRDPEIPVELGTDWTGLLSAMTARQPEDRPSAHDVALTLRHWLPAALSNEPESAETEAAVAELMRSSAEAAGAADMTESLTPIGLVRIPPVPDTPPRSAAATN